MANDIDDAQAFPATVEAYWNLPLETRKAIFLDTLTNTALPASFWLDFDKAREKSRRSPENLDDIDVLRGKSKAKFKEEIVSNPSLLRLVPTMLDIQDHWFYEGTRILRVKDMDANDDYDLDFGDIDMTRIDLYLKFVEDSGLGRALRNREIGKARQALFSIDCGTSTNARKNKSGKLGEERLVELLEQVISAHPGFCYLTQKKRGDIIDLLGIDIGEHFENRALDGIIHNGAQSLLLIETNIYNTPGSKVNSTVGGFIDDFNALASKQNISFLYLTDGVGWLSQQASLTRAIDKMPTINYRMAKFGYLDQRASKL